MKYFDLILIGYARGKIFQVEGDDCICPAMDGCCEDMAIIRIWQLERLHQIHMTLDDAVHYGSIH